MPVTLTRRGIPVTRLNGSIFNPFRNNFNQPRAGSRSPPVARRLFGSPLRRTNTRTPNSSFFNRLTVDELRFLGMRDPKNVAKNAKVAKLMAGLKIHANSNTNNEIKRRPTGPLAFSVLYGKIDQALIKKNKVGLVPLKRNLMKFPASNKKTKLNARINNAMRNTKNYGIDVLTGNNINLNGPHWVMKNKRGNPLYLSNNSYKNANQTYVKNAQFVSGKK